MTSTACVRIIPALIIKLIFAVILSGLPARAVADPVSGTVFAQPVAETSAGELDLSGGWKRRDDPGGSGMIAKWHTPKADDSRWNTAANPWEEPTVLPLKKGAKARGKKGPGAFWLRKIVSIPAGAPPRLFLSLSHPGDSVDVFINGVLLAKDIPGGVSAVREITRFTGTGEDFLLAMRVKKSRTGTGTGSVRIIMSSDSRSLFPVLREWISFLARENPLLSWPAWATGRPVMRAPVGLPGSLAPALVGGDGQMIPPDRSCVVSCWIYEDSTKKFYAPGSMSCAFSLDERVLPIPEVTVPMGRYTMYLRFWADSMEDEPGGALAVGEITVANASDRTRQVELFIAVHPLLPWEVAGDRGGFLDMTTVGHDPASRTILVNGKPAVILTTPADYFIAAPFEEGTVARTAASGVGGPSRAEDRHLRLASGAAVYRLKIQPFGARTMTYRVFLSGAPDQVTPEFTQAIRDVNRKWSQKENLNEWRRLLVGKDRFFLRIPDKRIQDAFYASIGHLLAGFGVGKRADAELVALALEQSGHHEFAVKLASSLAMPLASGGLASSLALTSTSGGLSSSPSLTSTSAQTAELSLPAGAFRPAEFIKSIRVISATEPAQAVPLLDKALKRMAAPGAFAWGEIEDGATGRWVGGEMPGLAASAEFILAMRGMLIRDDGDFVELAPAVPPAWLKPGNQVEIKNAPTRHGPLSYAITARESGYVVNLALAPPAPGGCRWRVPGKKRIGKLAVDGRAIDVPSDRIVVIPADARRVVVIW